MKRTLLVLSVTATLAVFTACGSNTNENEKTTDENAKVEKAEDTTAAKPNKKSPFASMDADGNGQVTREEFMTFLTDAFGKKDKNGDGKITADECGHFDQLNTDGDDYISDEEFMNGRDAIFDDMDADGDGNITKEEMKAHVKALKAKKAAADENN